jgi:hypothetical protein
MIVQVRHSQVINRQLAEFFRFYTQDHVRNHPCWDPDKELEQQTSGPMGVGMIINRRNRGGETLNGWGEFIAAAH